LTIRGNAGEMFCPKQKLNTYVLYFSTVKRKKPEIDVGISGCRNEEQPDFMEKIISAVINLVEPPWWPLIKGHLVPHENMRFMLVFLSTALLHNA